MSGYISPNGAPPFAPDQSADRIDIFDLEDSIVLRWWNEGRSQIISEVHMDRREAWVTGALLQVVAREKSHGR